MGVAGEALSFSVGCPPLRYALVSATRSGNPCPGVQSAKGGRHVQIAGWGLFFIRCAACPPAPVHSCDIDATRIVFSTLSVAAKIGSYGKIGGDEHEASGRAVRGYCHTTLVGPLAGERRPCPPAPKREEAAWACLARLSGRARVGVNAHIAGDDVSGPACTGSRSGSFRRRHAEARARWCPSAIFPSTCPASAAR